MGQAEKTFVSYAREDADFVRRLCGDLRVGGALVWVDTLDIGPGEAWDAAIARGLAECGPMLVVLSPESVASQNVLDEVGFALSKGKPVIPVLYRDCEVPYRLNRLQHIDFRNSYEESLQQLLAAMRDPRVSAGRIRPAGHTGSRRLYLGGGALAIAGLAAWAMLGFGPAAVDLKPPVKSGAAVAPTPTPIGQKTPANDTKVASGPRSASKLPFRDAFRSTLVQYITAAPNGFRALGAEEFVDWKPTSILPGAVSCRGSGYPREPVIECTVYKTNSEVEAVNKFEDLIDVVQNALPEWEGDRMNLFVAFFSSKKTPTKVGLDVTARAGQYEVTLSVRPPSRQ